MSLLAKSEDTQAAYGQNAVQAGVDRIAPWSARFFAHEIFGEGAHIALRVAGKVGSRLIPGAGWALAAHDAVQMTEFGYHALTGKDLADTAIGGVIVKADDAVSAAAAKVGDLALDGVSGVLNVAGYPNAAKIVNDDARYMLTGTDAAADPHAKITPLKSGAPQLAAEADLPETLTGPTPAADLAKIRAPAPLAAPPLSAAEAAGLADPPLISIEPTAAAQSQSRIAELSRNAFPPSRTSMLAAMAANANAALAGAPSSQGRGGGMDLG